MTTLLISLVAATLGAAFGLWSRRQVATLRYRNADELACPKPGPRNWLSHMTAIAWAGLGAFVNTTDSWALLPVLLPIAMAGPALAAIDLDVMRLPNRVLVPAALTLAVGLGSTVLTEGNTGTAFRGLAGGAIAGATFWLLNAATRGGVGMGDVKVVTLVGTAVGSVSLVTVWWALLTASVGALIWTKVSRVAGPFAYGPWVLAGAWTAVMLSAVLG